MSNLFWYILIGIIALVVSTCVIYKKRNTFKVSDLLVFYIFTAGFSWIGEFLVLGLFNAYRYKLNIYSSPWAENLLAHLILNTTLYPTVALLMVTFSYRYIYIGIAAMIFTVIEFIFIKLGIYEHHWWRYYMTTITVIGILLIANKVFKKIQEKCTGKVRAIIFFFGAMLIIHLPAPILLLLWKQRYKIGFVDNLFGDVYLSSLIIIFIYHLIECSLVVIFTCILKKWYWKVMPFIISITMQSLFLKMGILILSKGWHFIYTLIIYETFILIFILIEKNTVKPHRTLC